MGFIPALVAGGLGLAGEIFQGKQSESMAEQQMGFQERMANTAYQRTSKDMIAAGLNPALMYGSGSPVGVSGGAMGVAPNYGNAVGSAMQAIGLQAEVAQRVASAKATSQQGDAAMLNAIVNAVGRDKSGNVVYPAVGDDKRSLTFTHFPDGAPWFPVSAVVGESSAKASLAQAGYTKARTGVNSFISKIASDAGSLYDWLQQRVNMSKNAPYKAPWEQ